MGNNPDAVVFYGIVPPDALCETDARYSIDSFSEHDNIRNACVRLGVEMRDCPVEWLIAGNRFDGEFYVLAVKASVTYALEWEVTEVKTFSAPNQNANAWPTMLSEWCERLDVRELLDMPCGWYAFSRGGDS